MKRKGWDYLDHIIKTCEELFVCMQGVNSPVDLKESIVKRRAVVMCLLDLGELFKSLSEEEINLYPSESWRSIIGFRNRASHGYHFLDFDIVYRIVMKQVPPLYEFLKTKQQEQICEKNDDV